MNIAPKQYRNHLILETVQPLAGWLVSVWKARYDDDGVRDHQNTGECCAHVQRDNGQVGWPNGAGRVYKEPPGKTGETVSNKVGRKRDKD